MGYHDAWRRAGTAVEQSGTLPSDRERPNFWQWYAQNGEGASELANDAVCLVFPGSARCRPAAPPASPNPYDTRGISPVLIVAGVVVVVSLILLIKK